MTRKFKKRIKGFLTYHLPLHLTLLVVLWIVLIVRAWEIALSVYTGVAAVVYAYVLFRAWQDKRQRIYALHCARLETLVHDMIDLAFTYEGDHARFYMKFMETINIESLTKRGIIDPDAMLRSSRYNRDLRDMKRGDAELLALLAAGFSYREIKIIYGLKNLNSVYIKNHRMRCRISESMRQLIESNET